MTKTIRLIKKNWILILIVIVGAFLRFYKLDEIPGEMFGDVNANYKDIQSIMRGEHAIFFPANTGREPMLFYITAVLAQVFGLSYLVQKATVALIGVVTVVATYFFAKEFLDSKMAVFAALILAVSKWHIIFSRIGVRAILTPLFVQLTFIFLIRAFRRVRLKDFLFAGVFLGAGMYTYTAFRIMPVLVLFLSIAYLFWLVKRKREFILGTLSLFVVFSVIFAPLGIYAIKNPEAYWDHVGKKIIASEKEGVSPVDNLVKNVISQAGMLHIRGDIVFRVNPVHQPQVDVITAMLFIVGAIFIVFKYKRKMALIVGSSFLVLQLPSILSINYPVDVPSATRSTAAIPFILLVPAMGIYWFSKFIEKSDTLVINMMLLAVVLGMITLNYSHVFFDYAQGLPNRNTPFAKIIAQEIDKLSENTEVIVNSCCWGEWGQPEPDAIRFSLKREREIIFFEADNNSNPFDCREAKKNGLEKIFFIVNPSQERKYNEITKCFLGGERGVIEENGFKIADTYRVF